MERPEDHEDRPLQPGPELVPDKALELDEYDPSQDVGDADHLEEARKAEEDG